MKKIIKKVMPYLLVTSISVLFASCGTDEGKAGDEQSAAEATTAVTTTNITTSITDITTTSEAVTTSTNKKEKSEKSKKDKKEKEKETEAAEEPEEETLEEEEEYEEVQSGGSFSASDLYAYYGGYSLTINQDMSTFAEASSVDVSPSCYYDGDDKIFHYGDMDVYTYPYGESDLVLEIAILSGNVTTAKGLSVGMTVDDALAMYGPASESGGTYTWSDGNTYMYISSSGGVITSIGMALSN